MKKKYLMSAMAAVALGLTVAGCSTDMGGYSEADKLRNAESVLGVRIDPSQDWNMTSTVEARVSVSLGLDQKYTVVVYDENPLFNAHAAYYGKATVDEGSTATLSLAVPSAKTTYYVAVFDSKFRSVVNTATIENGLLTASFGAAPATRAASRAAEDASVYPDYVKTLDDYLTPAAPNSWSTVKAITVAEMEAYTPFDDNAFVTAGHATLSDGRFFENYGGDGKHYRVAAGTEVFTQFHINGTQNVVNDAVVYVQGKVHLTGNTLNGVTLVVGAGGEIVLDSDNNHFSEAGRLVVMAGGKVTASKDGVYLGVENGQANYNGGTIDFQGTLNYNGSDFYNNGTVNVDVFTGTAGGSKVTNFGSITARTNQLSASAYNQDIINGCYLHFTEDAGVGGLVLLDNSRIDVGGQLLITGGLYGGNRNKLYNLSEINANSIYWNNGVVEGPTAEGSFAVVKATKFLVSHANDLNTYNNVYFDIDPAEFYDYQNNKLDQTNIYTSAWHIQNNGDWCNSGISHYSNEASSAFTIPAGSCTGNGYNDSGNGNGQIIGDPVVYTFAFEDTFMGDYDMNDVVLQVAESAEDNKLDVTLCCTGATFNLYVCLNNADNKLFGGREVHAILGAPGKFINTGNPADERFVIKPSVTTQINKPANYNPATLDLFILSPQGEIHVGTQYQAGTAPYGVVIPQDWAWPTEWTPISSVANASANTSDETGAYPEFSGFAADRTANADWYNNPATGKVFRATDYQ